MKSFKKVFIACSVLSVSSFSAVVSAQEPAIACPGYQAPKTVLLGERVGKKLTNAFDAYNEDRIEEAIQILRDADPKEDFDKASVDRFLGQLLLSMDDKEKDAYDLFVGATKNKVLNDKDHAELLELNGHLALALEQYADAIDWYNKWMDFTCKESEKVWVRIAQAYNELKQYSKVVSPADKAIALQEEPNKNPYILKLNAFIETKEFLKAVKVAETLVQLFPTDRLWWSQLGMMYMMVEDYPKALETFSAAHRAGYLTKKNEFKALYQLYAQLDAPMQAARIFQKYLDSGVFDQTADEYAALANVYHQAKEFKLAAQFYGKAAQTDPDPDYYKKQGNLLLSAEDYRGAVNALKKAIDAGVDDPERVHFALMQANYYAGNYREAHSSAVEARKDNSLRRNVNAWIALIKNKAKNRGISI
ncbi:tetratricopeptide repeat protein [Glaciecola sp. 1036]|uniref:tetratricopeptide repeat protein n=1 Tax=Alteromonadaceae TaxID=72275 RepID=UPI003CFBED4F